MAESHPELSRDYFEREARKGRRVIFLWRVSTRWPNRADGIHWDGTPDPYIEGVELSTEEAARHFEIADHAQAWETFSTWEEAEAWLLAVRGAEPGGEG